MYSQCKHSTQNVLESSDQRSELCKKCVERNFLQTQLNRLKESKRGSVGLPSFSSEVSFTFSISLKQHIEYLTRIASSRDEQKIYRECLEHYQKASNQPKICSCSLPEYRQVRDCQCVWYPVESVQHLCRPCQQGNGRPPIVSPLLAGAPLSTSALSLPPTVLHHAPIMYPDCECRPISVIGRFYSAELVQQVGAIFGSRQGVSLGTDPRIALSVGSLDPIKWTLPLNDAWLLGVMQARHRVYLSIDRHAHCRDERLKTVPGKVGGENFFHNPLSWIWNQEERRLRITGRELHLLLMVGYTPYILDKPPDDPPLIFLGLEPPEVRLEEVDFAYFRKIMQIDEIRLPIIILEKLAQANWFSAAALALAKISYEPSRRPATRPQTPLV